VTHSHEPTSALAKAEHDQPLNLVDHGDYFNYLSRRSRLGAAYRRFVLYPRVVARLRGRCLDVGCGIGDMLLHRPDTIGADVNPRTVEFCRSRGAQASLMQPDQLPFDDGSFDSALMDNVLEHIAQPEALLRDVHRVLRPEGRLLVGVPGTRGWASDPDHKVLYDEVSLRDCVNVAGFTLKESFHTPLWRSSFLDRHIRQYCVYGLFVKA
jgi:SAM-dependent methyltransferase